MFYKRIKSIRFPLEWEHSKFKLNIRKLKMDFASGMNRDLLWLQ